MKKLFLALVLFILPSLLWVVPSYAYDFAGNGWTCDTAGLGTECYIPANGITANFHILSGSAHGVQMNCGTSWSGGLTVTGLNFTQGNTLTAGFYDDNGRIGSTFPLTNNTNYTIHLDCSAIPAVGTEGANTRSTSNSNLVIPGGIVYIQTDDVTRFNSVALTYDPTPTPRPGGGGAVTLDPSQAAVLGAATSSIPLTAASFVMSSFQSVLPYILLLIGLLLSYRTIKKYMSNRGGGGDNYSDGDAKPIIFDDTGMATYTDKWADPDLLLEKKKERGWGKNQDIENWGDYNWAVQMDYDTAHLPEDEFVQKYGSHKDGSDPLQGELPMKDSDEFPFSAGAIQQHMIDNGEDPF